VILVFSITVLVHRRYWLCRPHLQLRLSLRYRHHYWLGAPRLVAAAEKASAKPTDSAAGLSWGERQNTRAGVPAVPAHVSRSTHIDVQRTGMSEGQLSQHEP